MQVPCPLCNDIGMRLIERPDGSRVATDCTCRLARRADRMIERARIPQRHAHCLLENYETAFASADRSLAMALMQARAFVKAFPLETDGKGLLLVGTPGLGKTHLAVGILKALIAERSADGLFVDYRDLLKQVQNSYNSNVSVTELEVLRPVFTAEVLVLDDLGASKPTDWVFDTVAHILNSRYNDRLTTIITTNYPNTSETRSEDFARKSDAQKVMATRTLGDRIGNRVLSRLQEMCVTVELNGGDFRHKIRSANFG